MAHPPHSQLSASEAIDRIWQLMDDIGICMFITWDGERQRARPLAAMADRDEHAVYFLTDVSGLKDNQVERFPVVTMAFANTGSNKYVSVTGHATVSEDRAKIRELWSPMAKAWWDSADDPAIRLITVKPDDAELWDSPNRFVASVAMLTAAVTGSTPAVGDNKKVTM